MSITISLVQQTATSSTTLSLTRTLSGVARGNLLVVQFDSGENSIAGVTITDNNGNIWQIAKSLTYNDGSNHTIGIAYASNVNAGNTTVTIANATTFSIAANLAEYNQTGVVGGYLAVDQSVSATGNSTSPSSGNVTTLYNNELAIGMIKCGAGSLSAGAGWTENTNFLGTIVPEYQILTTISTLAATATSASGAWGAVIATFFVFIPIFNTLAGRFNGAGQLVGNLIVPIWTGVSTSPVTVAANTTSDQDLMSYVIPANTLNSVNRTLRVHCKGVYSTPISSTATLEFKVQLGSLTLVDIVTSANAGSVSNNSFLLDVDITTQTAGSSAEFESSGALSIDLGALMSSAAAIFLDTNSAVSSTLDTTADQTLQITVAFSAGSASNSCTQRQLVLNTVN